MFCSNKAVHNAGQCTRTHALDKSRLILDTGETECLCFVWRNNLKDMELNLSHIIHMYRPFL